MKWMMSNLQNGVKTWVTSIWNHKPNHLKSPFFSILYDSKERHPLTFPTSYAGRCASAGGVPPSDGSHSSCGGDRPGTPPCLTSGFGTDSLSFPKKSTIFLGGAVKNFGAPSCFKVGSWKLDDWYYFYYWCWWNSAEWSKGRSAEINLKSESRLDTLQMGETLLKPKQQWQIWIDLHRRYAHPAGRRPTYHCTRCQRTSFTCRMQLYCQGMAVLRLKSLFKIFNAKQPKRCCSGTCSDCTMESI